MTQNQTTSPTAAERTERAAAGGQHTQTGGDPVTAALIALIDSALAEGQGRSTVLAAALEVVALDPTPADLAATHAEIHAEHESLVRVLSAVVPGQRGAGPASGLLGSSQEIRDRRLEVVDLARTVVQFPGQRS